MRFIMLVLVFAICDWYFFWCGDFRCLSVIRVEWLLATKHLWGAFDSPIPIFMMSISPKDSFVHLLNVHNGPSWTLLIFLLRPRALAMHHNRPLSDIILHSHAFLCNRYGPKSNLADDSLISCILNGLNRSFLDIHLSCEFSRS